MKIFYATDIHGSETCWRKFLNAASFYRADILVLGGDMTGKALVPIIDYGDHFEVTLQGEHRRLDPGREVAEVEKYIRGRGLYPLCISPERARRFAADEDELDRAFRAEIVRTVERWMEVAEEKLRGRDIPCFVCPGNDDILEIDDVLRRCDYVELAESRAIDLGNIVMGSMGWTNPTPWNTHREATEEQLDERIAKITVQIEDYDRAIFNFHAPPYGSNLDDAPALDENLNLVSGGQATRPVGSTAVRNSIDSYQPLLSLHGHIHEARGTARLGRTLAINPGSAYGDGVLQGAVIQLNAKKGKVRTYVLVDG